MAAKPPRTALAFQDDQALMGPQQSALLDAMKKAGGRDVRMNVIYGKVREEGFGKYDELVNAARARGLRVQATIMGTPRYNPNWDQALSWQNNDPRRWHSFANEVAKHFKGRVGRYTPGNEMQFDTFLKGADTTTEKGARAAGRRYRAIYRAGYAGIKAADPTAQVLLGDFSSTPNARAWLAGVTGGKRLRTAGVAFHPYDQPNAQVAAMNTWDIDTLKDLQATLARYKQQGKLQTAKGGAAPLYLTEFGYQRADIPNDSRRAALVARAARKAQEAGARQFLSYQLTPKEKPMVAGDPVSDAYGQMLPGAPKRSEDWIWDTSVHPLALAAAMARSKPRARAARGR